MGDRGALPVNYTEDDDDDEVAIVGVKMTKNPIHYSTVIRALNFTRVIKATPPPSTLQFRANDEYNRKKREGEGQPPLFRRKAPPQFPHIRRVLMKKVSFEEELHSSVPTMDLRVSEPSKNNMGVGGKENLVNFESELGSSVPSFDLRAGKSNGAADNICIDIEDELELDQCVSEEAKPETSLENSSNDVFCTKSLEETISSLNLNNPSQYNKPQSFTENQSQLVQESNVYLDKPISRRHSVENVEPFEPAQFFLVGDKLEASECEQSKRFGISTDYESDSETVPVYSTTDLNNVKDNTTSHSHIFGNNIDYMQESSSSFHLNESLSYICNNEEDERISSPLPPVPINSIPSILEQEGMPAVNISMSTHQSENKELISLDFSPLVNISHTNLYEDTNYQVELQEDLKSDSEVDDDEIQILDVIIKDQPPFKSFEQKPEERVSENNESIKPYPEECNCQVQCVEQNLDYVDDGISENFEEYNYEGESVKQNHEQPISLHQSNEQTLEVYEVDENIELNPEEQDYKDQIGKNTYVGETNDPIIPHQFSGIRSSVIRYPETEDELTEPFAPAFFDSPGDKGEIVTKDPEELQPELENWIPQFDRLTLHEEKMTNFASNKYSMEIESPEIPKILATTQMDCDLDSSGSGELCNIDKLVNLAQCNFGLNLAISQEFPLIGIQSPDLSPHPYQTVRNLSKEIKNPKRKAAKQTKRQIPKPIKRTSWHKPKELMEVDDSDSESGSLEGEGDFKETNYKFQAFMCAVCWRLDFHSLNDLHDHIRNDHDFKKLLKLENVDDELQDIGQFDKVAKHTLPGIAHFCDRQNVEDQDVDVDDDEWEEVPDPDSLSVSGNSNESVSGNGSLRRDGDNDDFSEIDDEYVADNDSDDSDYECRPKKRIVRKKSTTTKKSKSAEGRQNPKEPVSVSASFTKGVQIESLSSSVPSTNSRLTRSRGRGRRN